MKKQITAFLLSVVPITLYGAPPATSCPTGYITIVESNMIIAANNCPAGYKSADTATSCLTETPTGTCMMFAPAGMKFSDDSGTYEFTEICPLE